MQIAKALREYNASGNFSIEHYKCFIHRMRSLYSKLKDMKLNSVPKEYDKKTFGQKLASSLQARIRLELSRYRKSNRDDAQYTKKAKACMENMLNCFQGNHSSCRMKSLVCERHLKSYTPKHLPYGKHIQLSAEDIDRLNLEAICTGDATTIPLSEKLPVRCRVKIQVNEAMIQIIIGRYKKKKVISLFIATFYIVRRLWKIEINIRIASQSFFCYNLIPNTIGLLKMWVASGKKPLR